MNSDRKEHYFLKPINNELKWANAGGEIPFVAYYRVQFTSSRAYSLISYVSLYSIHLIFSGISN